jgi:ankyrin repeat protein
LVNELGALIHIYSRDKFGRSPSLHLACFKGYLDVVRNLLKLGADINRTNDGETPLMVAVMSNRHEFVKWLVKAGQLT